MKYYIATKLENVEFYHKVKDLLLPKYTITYDWTTHGSVKETDKTTIRKVAINETEGIVNAKFIIALLPGGRGTHVEIGIAIALSKPVLIYSENPKVFEATKETCAFYHYPLVTHFTKLEDILEWLK